MTDISSKNRYRSYYVAWQSMHNNLVAVKRTPQYTRLVQHLGSQLVCVKCYNLFEKN